MEAQNLRDHLEAELEFPTDLETVLNDIGGTEIEAPNSDTSMTISDILGHLDEGTYETPDELREIILANEPEEYVGRSHYSDRGPEGNQPANDDREQESF